MTLLNSSIVKGGALLDDSRRLVEVWDPELDSDANVAHITEGNLLGKRSRSRAVDVLKLVLLPRFVAPGPQVILSLKGLLLRPAAFREACYYEASRSDALIAAFAEEALNDWYDAGRTTVRSEDVQQWLASLAKGGRIPPWGDQVRTRAARGLLATARDFGVLEGQVIKRFATPRLSPVGFAYVAFREQEQGTSSRSLIASRVWRRWLLDTARVEELFAMAERLGVLRYARVGSAVRIDWIVPDLEAVTRAAA